MLLTAKSWFIALLLLAFVSQSTVALAMSCDLQHQNMSHSVMTTDHHADHSDIGIHHEMDFDSFPISHDNSSEPSDCCATANHCIFGGCSLPALNNELTLNPVLANTFAMVAYDRDYLSISAPSLYRPPIFR